MQRINAAKSHIKKNKKAKIKTNAESITINTKQSVILLIFLIFTMKYIKHQSKITKLKIQQRSQIMSDDNHLATKKANKYKTKQNKAKQNKKANFEKQTNVKNNV